MDLKGTCRSFVSILDLSAEEILATLDLAGRLKRQRERLVERAPLRGRTLGMIFQKPSLRTRVSFEAGMTLLGGHAIYLAPSDIRLGERESVEDVARVLSRYVDVLVARTFGHEIVEELARHASVPVINGLSDAEHPCQILADLMTIRERKGRLSELKIAYIGDGNNVARSLLLAAARLGLTMDLACPSGYEPPQPVQARARQVAGVHADRLRIVHDPAQAAAGADVLYTDVWASMGQEHEAAQRRERFRGFQVNRKLAALARPDVIVLHCLPAHYGEEIEYELTRSAGSAIFDQAENRLHAQNALLLELLGASAGF